MHNKEYIRETEEKGTYEYWCPGCKRHHFANRKTWNINLATNTLSPSYLLTTPRPNGKDMICHSWIRKGMIQFPNDCTHELAGKTVSMEPLK